MYSVTVPSENVPLMTWADQGSGSDVYLKSSKDEKRGKPDGEEKKWNNSGAEDKVREMRVKWLEGNQAIRIAKNKVRARRDSNPPRSLWACLRERHNEWPLCYINIHSDQSPHLFSLISPLIWSHGRERERESRREVEGRRSGCSWGFKHDVGVRNLLFSAWRWKVKKPDRSFHF